MDSDLVISLFGLFGLCVSLFAIYVEYKKTKNNNYVSVCDINNRVNCSKVLTSKYSRLTKLLFGLPDNHVMNIPNTYYGVLFYLAVFVYPLPLLTYIPFREILFFCASVGSMILSLFLAFILYYVLDDFCIVCVTTYFINLVIFYYAWDELV